MKHLTKTFPILFVSMGYAQLPMDTNGKKIDFGFSSSTFAGGSVNYLAVNYFEKENLYSYLPLNKPKTTFSNYGWKQGFFIWVNLSPKFAYKAQADVTFCINNFNQLSELSQKKNYCTSFGIEFKPQLIIRFGAYDPEPVFKMARDMSYYVNGRQNYFILGPKFSYAKPDKTFSGIYNVNYSSAGVVAGIGSDNLFPCMDFAPELLLSLEYRTRNSQSGSSPLTRYYVSLSLAVNFF